LRNLTESYCQIFSDDDFIFEDTLNKSIEYLKNNYQYSSAQGLQIDFYYKNFKVPKAIDIDYSLINRETDSRFKNIRLFQAFTNRFVNRVYSVVKKEILLDILKSAKPLLTNYYQCMEIYFICCLTLIGKDKIFQEIGWMKGQHDDNLHKNEKYLADYWILNKKFFLLFYSCLNNFSKKRNINNFLFFYLFFIFFIFKIKLILIGYSKFFKILFNKIGNLERNKKTKLSEDIYFKDIKKIQRIKNFLI
jgi:hypothetical protein